MCISVLLQVSLNIHWSVSYYFFYVYICLYKKAYHLPPDWPLPMAPPPLMPPPLLPPLLLPSLRPLLQVSAGFSRASLPPTPLPHFPTLSVSCCYHHLTAATPAPPPPPLPLPLLPLCSDGCCDCTTNSLALSSLLSTNIYLSGLTHSLMWEMLLA